MTDDTISRQTALDALDELCDVVCAYSKKQRAAMCGACPLGSAFDVIEELPTTDAVEVVRCGECKHNSLKRVSGNTFCDLGIGLSQIYDFCSKGDRKDG